MGESTKTFYDSDWTITAAAQFCRINKNCIPILPVIFDVFFNFFHVLIKGGLLSYFRGLLGSREMRILILGLDGAGKTTILYRLQVGEVVTTIPTIGFNVEQVTYKNLKFQVWDLGGQTSIRPYWRCYYSNTDAIIYVVDSADRDRIGISKDELLYMLRV